MLWRETEGTRNEKRRPGQIKKKFKFVIGCHTRTKSSSASDQMVRKAFLKVRWLWQWDLVPRDTVIMKSPS